MGSLTHDLCAQCGPVLEPTLHIHRQSHGLLLDHGYFRDVRVVLDERHCGTVRHMRLALFLCSERDNSLVNSSASVVMPASVTMSVPDSTYVVPSVPVPRTSPSSPKSWKDGGKSDAVDVCALVTAAKNRGRCLLDAERERRASTYLQCTSECAIQTTLGMPTSPCSTLWC